MIVLCILAMVWLGVRVATTWKMCARLADHESPEPDASAWRLGRPQDAVRPAGPEDAKPQDAAYTPQPAAEAEDDLWVPTRVLLVALSREVARALGEAASRWAASADAASRAQVTEQIREEPPVKPQEAPTPSFFAVPRPEGGPACLGGREDSAYLRGWDDAVDWISNLHDAAAPTWGGVAYMTGWDDAARAIAKARVSAGR